MAADVRLLADPFDPAAKLAAFTAAHPAAGGVVSFLGQVRSGEGVEALELRHYPPLTLPGMTALGQAVLARWALDGLLILHRHGQMTPGDPIVLVAAAARHRRDAFAAHEHPATADRHLEQRVARQVLDLFDPGDRRRVPAWTNDDVPGPVTMPGRASATWCGASRCVVGSSSR